MSRSRNCVEPWKCPSHASRVSSASSRIASREPDSSGDKARAVHRMSRAREIESHHLTRVRSDLISDRRWQNFRIGFYATYVSDMTRTNATGNGGDGGGVVVAPAKKSLVRIGKYQMLGPLGKGNFARVEEAIHTVLGVKVSVINTNRRRVQATSPSLVCTTSTRRFTPLSRERRKLAPSRDRHKSFVSDARNV